MFTNRGIYTSHCPYGGSASPNPPGLRLYPSIYEPRRRVVGLIESPTCEMLRDFQRSHENVMVCHFTGSKYLTSVSKQLRKSVNHN